jgi:Protein of unknown function (DUF4019)
MDPYNNRSNSNVRLCLIAIFVPCLVLGSCSSASNKQIADQAVTEFHRQLDSEQYHAIYTGSDEKLRQAFSEADFVALLEAVHRKLGTVQRANLQSFQVGWFAGQGQVVTLVYNTRFVNSNADEKFVWHINGDHPLLVGYFINSNALITR